VEKREMHRLIEEVFAACPGNVISEEIAMSPEVVGIAMFETPLVGVASAEDDLFETYKEVGVIGPWFMGPEEWLPGAKTVVSLFFPFTEEVRASNRACAEGPSQAWVHARVEGQGYLNTYMKLLKEKLEAMGIRVCAPSIDGRFVQVNAGSNREDYPFVTQDTYGSNWSERHVAFASGLGTFGLSKGLITKKGMAGRFASIIIDAEMQPDERPYTDVYEYCTMCGACVRRCPVGAITREGGKRHAPCDAWLQETKKQFAPRFGCGLCQTKVPCESGIPKKR